MFSQENLGDFLGVVHCLLVPGHAVVEVECFLREVREVERDVDGREEGPLRSEVGSAEVHGDDGRDLSEDHGVGNEVVGKFGDEFVVCLDLP